MADSPATWQALYEEGAANDGFAYQGAPYEGLTCNFVELSSAAGGTILSEDGKKAEFDSPENLEALKLMVDGMKSGGAVKASRTFMEEPARMAFESGKATFMRNWSYAYALAKKAKKTKDVVEVSPLPPGTLVHGKLANGLSLENSIRPVFVGRGFGNYEDRKQRDDVRYILTYVAPALGYEGPVILDVLLAYPKRAVIMTFDVAETTAGGDRAALFDKFGPATPRSVSAQD